MELISILLRSLMLTILIEGTVLYLITKRSHDVVVSMLFNTMTNPALNFLLVLVWQLIGKEQNLWIYYSLLAFLEFIAVVIEAYIMKDSFYLSKTKAFYLSIILNGSSFTLGLLLERLL